MFTPVDTNYLSSFSMKRALEWISNHARRPSSALGLAISFCFLVTWSLRQRAGYVRSIGVLSRHWLKTMFVQGKLQWNSCFC